MSEPTMNPTLLPTEVDLIANVILWEMMRQGDWDSDAISLARDVAREILTAQRQGYYRHRICERADGRVAAASSGAVPGENERPTNG